MKAQFLIILTSFALGWVFAQSFGPKANLGRSSQISGGNTKFFGEDSNQSAKFDPMRPRKYKFRASGQSQKENQTSEIPGQDVAGVQTLGVEKVEEFLSQVSIGTIRSHINRRTNELFEDQIENRFEKPLDQDAEKHAQNAFNSISRVFDQSQWWKFESQFKAGQNKFDIEVFAKLYNSSSNQDVSVPMANSESINPRSICFEADILIKGRVNHRTFIHECMDQLKKRNNRYYVLGSLFWIGSISKYVNFISFSIPDDNSTFGTLEFFADGAKTWESGEDFRWNESSALEFAEAEKSHNNIDTSENL